MTAKSLCGARKRQTEGTCARPAGWGTTHPGVGCCKLHGGSTRDQTTAAERELAENAVSSLGLPRDVDPHTALLEEVRRTAGHVGMLELIVGQLDRDKLVHGVTQTVQLPDGSRRVTAQATFNVWLRLYHTERKHLLVACRAAIKSGVEERRVELEQRQGQLIADVFRLVYDDETLGLSNQQREAAMVATARHLRAVAEREPKA